MGQTHLRRNPLKTKTSFEKDFKLGRYAYSFMQGWRNTMEDMHIANVNLQGMENCYLFAVFDGHGGKEISVFCEHHFVEVLEQNENFKNKNFELALKETFLKLDEMIADKQWHEELKEIQTGLPTDMQTVHLDENRKIIEEPFICQAGTTATVALIYNQTLYLANAGDSRTVLCVDGVAEQPLHDHKPELKEEFDRITKAGGQVYDGRINGEINLCRAIGDHEYKSNKQLDRDQQMIIATPDVKTIQLTKSHQFMLLGCDGIWEQYTNQQLVDFVASSLIKQQTSKQPQNLVFILEQLLENLCAQDTKTRYGLDNMTSMLVQFNNTNPLILHCKEPILFSLEFQQIQLQQQLEEQEKQIQNYNQNVNMVKPNSNLIPSPIIQQNQNNVKFSNINETGQQ